MVTTGIRLEVEPWLHEILTKEQEQRRQKTGRKQSLSTIIIEFCTKGLTVSNHIVQNNSCSVQTSDASVQNFQGFVQNKPDVESRIYQTGLDDITKLKESLLREQQDLKEKERRLAIKEHEIKERENELTERTRQANQEWNEILDIKGQSQLKNIDKIQLNWLNEQQQKELCDKTETIKKLKQENVQLKEDIIKTLRKIDQQTGKSVILDYIVPFLPSVISIIGFFMTNRKIDHIQDLSPIQAEIGNLMKKLNETDRQKLSTKLEESLKAFTVQPVSAK
jgi:hypothetical protein